MTTSAPEVIVVGAGPAGSATAYHLARAGIATLLVDKLAFPRDKVCGDCLSPRAQQALIPLGLLDTVAAEAYQATRIRLRAPCGAQAHTQITGNGILPDRTLVLPRRRLDHLLQARALSAGVQFEIGHVRALRPEGGVRLHGEPRRARLVVIATGAALGLLKSTALAPRGPVHSLAARGYLEGLPELGPELHFLFDQLPLPGYAWLFPTGAHQANLGYWYNGRAGMKATTVLPRLLTEHALLRELTAGAAWVGPIAGYPIRSDFLSAPLIAPGVLAVGEAAGLVNPFTGEGIDYALESAELAATAICRALRASPGAGCVSVAHLRPYPQALRARFRTLFLLMRAAQRYAFNPWVFNRLFGRDHQGQALVDALIQVCFGAAPPTRILAPGPWLRLLISKPTGCRD